ncbi:MAG: hypothetical protein AB8H12_02355 [Lewinella sp.]
MERLDRPLTVRDRKLLELYLIQAKRGILDRPGWTTLLIVSGICLLTVYESWETSWVWPIIATLVFVVVNGGFLWMILNDKKRYRENILKVEKMLVSETVTVRRYTCTDALVFETEEDTGHVWALQIGPRQVMIWMDYHYEYANILPSRTFDLIDDERLVRILGKTISNGQGHFSPTYVSMSVVGNAALDHLPDEPGAILATTLDELLEDAKGWV